MRCLTLFVGCAALVSGALPAIAQDEPPKRANVRPMRPEGGPAVAQPRRAAALTPEQAEAAWKLEATGVARRLGVEEAKTADVVKAYVEARKSHDAASEKLREERRAGGGGGGRGAEFLTAMQDLAAAERAKLEKSLAAVLSADQASKAAASLGTFHRPWDQMVHIISGFGLDTQKQQQALNAIEEYVVAQTGMMSQRGPDADREAIAAASREARNQLSDELKGILTEEQFGQIQAALGAGARPRGPRPQGDPDAGPGGN